jgi:hypothetical protein
MFPTRDQPSSLFAGVGLKVEIGAEFFMTALDRVLCLDDQASALARVDLG